MEARGCSGSGGTLTQCTMKAGRVPNAESRLGEGEQQVPKCTVRPCTPALPALPSRQQSLHLEVNEAPNASPHITSYDTPRASMSRCRLSVTSMPITHLRHEGIAATVCRHADIYRCPVTGADVQHTETHTGTRGAHTVKHRSAPGQSACRVCGRNNNTNSDSPTLPELRDCATLCPTSPPPPARRCLGYIRSACSC